MPKLGKRIEIIFFTYDMFKIYNTWSSLKKILANIRCGWKAK
jgi:hypothetical protein